MRVHYPKRGQTQYRPAGLLLSLSVRGRISVADIQCEQEPEERDYLPAKRKVITTSNLGVGRQKQDSP